VTDDPVGVLVSAEDLAAIVDARSCRPCLSARCRRNRRGAGVIETLRSAVISGEPPLGPGAPARERLLAFFAAWADLATDNFELYAAYSTSTPDPALKTFTHSGVGTSLNCSASCGPASSTPNFRRNCSSWGHSAARSASSSTVPGKATDSRPPF